jgi:pimeloyl-ACP methyl ester carboxylesterase
MPDGISTSEPDIPPLEHRLHGDPTLPPLVLLHAGGMTREEWSPFLEGWSPHFRLVAPTALGHGASPNVDALSVAAMAASVLHLLDRLGIGRAHFLGSSMGGSTALEVARHRPERVDRLVLYRCGYRTGPGAREALERLAAPETWRRWGLERAMERQHAPQGGPDAWKKVIRRVVEGIARPGAGATVEDLARIRCPTLLIGGDRDDLAPLDDLVAMYRALPAASLWIVPGAGHLLSMETWRRRAFQEEVRRFLSA